MDDDEEKQETITEVEEATPLEADVRDISPWLFDWLSMTQFLWLHRHCSWLDHLTGGQKNDSVRCTPFSIDIFTASMMSNSLPLYHFVLLVWLSLLSFFPMAAHLTQTFRNSRQRPRNRIICLAIDSASCHKGQSGQVWKFTSQISVYCWSSLLIESRMPKTQPPVFNQNLEVNLTLFALQSYVTFAKSAAPR